MIKKMISLAMDKGPRERELTSRLLTSLHPTPLADRDMELGFATLLDSLEDLQTDVPDAIVRLSVFCFCLCGKCLFGDVSLWLPRLFTLPLTLSSLITTYIEQH